MRNYSAADVDEYIAGADEAARPVMVALRKLIFETVPEVTESISWGVPFYKFHGLLGGYSVFTNHVSFGLAFTFDAKMREDLEAKGYKTGSKTVQIRFDQAVPAAEIRKILLAKAAENEARRA